MAHESFEDKEVGEYLNEHFISIKVDKEERPDIDSVYMSVCQKITGSGGWPLTVFMLPNQKPFFAGTYFPKKVKYQLPGLIDLLEAVVDKWDTERKDIEVSSEEITKALKEDALTQTQDDTLAKEDIFTTKMVKKATRSLTNHFDKEFGGFGRTPKFPTPHNLMFLLRVAHFEQDNKISGMVEKTLDSMYQGGIFDHIGYGFSRYSTDETWLVPHFEKMLYDNALLVMAYSEAYQITQKVHYKQIAEKTMDYVLRELTDNEGGFYCAQDADSEGVEGKYYVFTPEEIIQLLGEEDGKYFNQYFDITKQGNFEGANIPNLIPNKNLDDTVKIIQDNLSELLNPSFKSDENNKNTESYNLEKDRISDLREKVYEYRVKRMNLHKDDKILTSWNGIMIAAFAKAYHIFGDERYLQAAKKADQFLQENLSNGEHLYVHYRDGKAVGQGHIDDYSFYAWALMEMYHATLEVSYLERSIRYIKVLIDKFYDRKEGGFYLYAEDAEELIHRPKELYDGAIPSGNSVAAYILLKLSKLTGDPSLTKVADEQIAFIAKNISVYPSAYCFSMMALIEVIYPTKELVCVVQNSEQAKEIRETLGKHFLPNVSVLLKNINNQDQLASISEFTKDYEIRVTIELDLYLCENYACKAPVHSIEDLENLLVNR
jgi:hypothetical protein